MVDPRKKKSENNLRKIVASKNGECLFDNYSGSNKKFSFRCEKGHVFTTYSYRIVNCDYWCKFCKEEERKKNNFETLRKLAVDRGGKLNSTKINLIKNKYEFVCSLGHLFKLRAIDAINGQWCNNCSKYIKERICRIIIEYICVTTLNSATPSWLKTKTGTQLHLDGYCPQKKIGFEYNGKQHYSFVPMYHKDETQLEKQKKRDKEKYKLCKKYGVTLVIIPEYTARNNKSIQNHVSKACKQAGLNLPSNSEMLEIDFSRAYISKDLNRIKQAETVLKKLKGKLICYQGGVCQVECLVCGNRWHIKYTTLIKEISWCRKCSGNHKKDLNYLHVLAKSKNGTCLADEYVNIITKVRWRCSVEGHPSWLATPNSIQQGRWCPECARITKSNNAKKQWANGKLGRYCNKGT